MSLGSGEGSYDTDAKVKDLKTHYGSLLLDRYFNFLTSDEENFLTFCPCVVPGHAVNAPTPKRRRKTTSNDTKQEQELCLYAFVFLSCSSNFNRLRTLLSQLASNGLCRKASAILQLAMPGCVVCFQAARTLSLTPAQSACGTGW